MEESDSPRHDEFPDAVNETLDVGAVILDNTSKAKNTLKRLNALIGEGELLLDAFRYEVTQIYESEQHSITRQSNQCVSRLNEIKTILKQMNESLPTSGDIDRAAQQAFNSTSAFEMWNALHCLISSINVNGIDSG